MTNTDEDENTTLTYAAMLDEWISGEPWIKKTDPLVFHLKKLCAVLDAQLSSVGEATGPMNTAYLQALSRLEKKRPGANTGAGELPGQSSIFDELD